MESLMTPEQQAWEDWRHEGAFFVPSTEPARSEYAKAAKEIRETYQ